MGGVLNTGTRFFLEVNKKITTYYKDDGFRLFAYNLLKLHHFHTIHIFVSLLVCLMLNGANLGIDLIEWLQFLYYMPA